MGLVTESCWCFEPGASVAFSRTIAESSCSFSLKIAWLSIGLASWRFRKAWVRQGRDLDELKFHAAWTWPWGPLFVVRVSHQFLYFLHEISLIGDHCVGPHFEYALMVSPLHELLILAVWSTRLDIVCPPFYGHRFLFPVY